MKECPECHEVYDASFCPACDDGGYGDWLYEQWKDRQMEEAHEEPLSAYEERVNRGAYD
jgi:hypothetical protein